LAPPKKTALCAGFGSYWESRTTYGAKQVEDLIPTLLDIGVVWEIEGGVFKAVAATARLVHSRHVLRAALALFDCVSLLYPIL